MTGKSRQTVHCRLTWLKSCIWSAKTKRLKFMIFSRLKLRLKTRLKDFSLVKAKRFQTTRIWPKFAIKINIAWLTWSHANRTHALSPARILKYHHKIQNTSWHRRFKIVFQKYFIPFKYNFLPVFFFFCLPGLSVGNMFYVFSDEGITVLQPNECEIRRHMRRTERIVATYVSKCSKQKSIK